MIHDHHNVTTHLGSNLIERQRFKRRFDAFDFIMFSVVRRKSGGGSISFTYDSRLVAVTVFF